MMNEEALLSLITGISLLFGVFSGLIGLRKSTRSEAGKHASEMMMVIVKLEDISVGVTEIKKIGTQVKQGEPLLMIQYNDETNLDAAMDYFRNAYRLAPRRPTPPPIVVERVA